MKPSQRQLAARLLRFGAVGAAATLCYFAVASLGALVLGLRPGPNNLLAWCISVAVSYLGHNHYTFQVGGEHGRYLPRFLFATALLGLASALLTHVAEVSFGLSAFAIGAVVSLAYPAMSLLLSMLWVFVSKPVGQAQARPVLAGPLGPRLRRHAAWVLVLAGLAVMVGLHQLAPAAYDKVISVFFYFDKPQPYIFHDWGFVTAAVECWQQGRDIYQGNPCDVEHRAYVYSPLLLRLPFLSVLVLPTWVGAGLLIAAFIAALAQLPPPRDAHALAVVLLATVSSATVFGLERGNLDLLVFAVAVAATLGLRRTPALRAAAYGGVVVAACLKFYPVLLGALALRERPRRILLPLAAITLAMLGFAATFADELRLVMHNLQQMEGHWGPYSDRFGARQTVQGLWQAASVGSLADLRPGAPGLGTVALAPPRWAMPLLALLALLAALALARSAGFVQRWRALSVPEADCLVTGAVLIAGCFFAGNSVAYRGIFLLMALPGLLQLARARNGRYGRFIDAGLPLAVIYSAWAPTTQHLMAYWAKAGASGSVGKQAQFLDWCLHELCWWWIVTVLLAVLLRFAIESPVGQVALQGQQARLAARP